MGITSLQVCMDSSDWLQGTMHEVETGMDSSSPISGDNILTCSRPLIERRLRPPHDQALKCPRCDSTHTKFCYYNNYSLSQPRYFCKTCRRYWTKGGTLRNIPVGGGCRKNKKVSSKNKSNINEPNSLLINNNQNFQGISTNNNPTDLQLSSFPDQMSTLNLPHNFMGNYNNSFMLENHSTPIDFMESKYEDLVGSSSSRNQDHFLGNTDHNIGMLMSNSTGFGGHHENIVAQNFTQHAGFGVTTMDHMNNDFGTVMDLSHHHQRLMLPNYETITNQEEQINHHDVKPNPKMLSLEWHHDQQGCSDHAGKESSFGYIGSNWSGLMNGYGSSATNPLV